MQKKTILSLLLSVALTIPTTAQTNENTQTVISSIPNKDAKFLLFPTKNIYNFLKLNTRTGEVYVVQYTINDPKHRFETKIDSWLYPLVSKEEESNGRFYLYPTFNIYNFILVDQVDGRVWQLQWDLEGKNRMLLRIENATSMAASQLSYERTIYVSFLEKKNNLYCMGGELFTGNAYSEDKMVSVFINEGRYYKSTVYHFNLKEVAFTFTNEEDIPDNVPRFYDDYGNEIDKEEFIKKYPAVIRKAKEFAKTLK